MDDTLAQCYVEVRKRAEGHVTEFLIRSETFNDIIPETGLNSAVKSTHYILSRVTDISKAFKVQLHMEAEFMVC